MRVCVRMCVFVYGRVMTDALSFTFASWLPYRFLWHNWLEQLLNALVLAFIGCATLFLSRRTRSGTPALVAALVMVLVAALAAAAFVLLRELQSLRLRHSNGTNSAQPEGGDAIAMDVKNNPVFCGMEQEGEEEEDSGGSGTALKAIN